VYLPVQVLQSAWFLVSSTPLRTGIQVPCPKVSVCPGAQPHAAAIAFHFQFRPFRPPQNQKTENTTQKHPHHTPPRKHPSPAGPQRQASPTHHASTQHRKALPPSSRHSPTHHELRAPLPDTASPPPAPHATSSASPPTAKPVTRPSYLSSLAFHVPRTPHRRIAAPTGRRPEGRRPAWQRLARPSYRPSCGLPLAYSRSTHVQSTPGDLFSPSLPVSRHGQSRRTPQPVRHYPIPCSRRVHGRPVASITSDDLFHIHPFPSTQDSFQYPSVSTRLDYCLPPRRPLAGPRGAPPCLDHHAPLGGPLPPAPGRPAACLTVQAMPTPRLPGAMASATSSRARIAIPPPPS
jgi:hypothetical protein